MANVLMATRRTLAFVRRVLVARIVLQLLMRALQVHAKMEQLAFPSFDRTLASVVQALQATRAESISTSAARHRVSMVVSVWTRLIRLRFALILLSVNVRQVLKPEEIDVLQIYALVDTPETTAKLMLMNVCHPPAAMEAFAKKPTPRVDLLTAAHVLQVG